MLMFLQTAYPDVSVPSVPAFAVVGPTSTPCSMPPCGSGGAGCSGAWVYFTANGKIMSTEFGKVATNFFQCVISTSLRAALRMFSYRSRSVWVNQMTGGLLGSYQER